MGGGRRLRPTNSQAPAERVLDGYVPPAGNRVKLLVRESGTRMKTSEGGRMRAVLMMMPVLALAGCAGSPLYHTSKTYAPSAGESVYLMPYYTKVETELTVAITEVQKSNTDQSAGGSVKPPKTPPPKTPTDAQPESAKPTLSQFSITLGTVNIPSDKRYLYFNNSGWYNSAVEFDTSLNGLPSKSDTSSTQQLTSLLTELAQTAGQALGGGLKFLKEPIPSTPPALSLADLRKACAQMLKAIAPSYAVIASFDRAGAMDIAPPQAVTVGSNPVDITLAVVLDGDGALPAKELSPIGEGDIDGFVAYEPTPLLAHPVCKGGGNSIDLGLPQILSVYKVRHVEKPLRNFWTSPQDTYSITDGIIVGHKYTDQSAAKTLVDLITAPARAAIPSTSVTTQTQLQTGGGKPDQTTNTTITQVSPPK
ncbi:MAG TPA: hypothetical protein VEI03_23475 [Stellaceae bacterium]|nr:hypothetical protein [Stellaceae bacterium]